MSESEFEVLPPDRPQPPPARQWWKQLLAPIGVALAALLKFGASLKFLLLPLLKFLPILLKTGGSMILMIWVYARGHGWPFAVGFVLLIFVHECGHLIAARHFGLKVGAPVFIPFMGAVIALKDMPPNAWIEAVVGIGGPVAGSLGGLVCHIIYLQTGDSFWGALALSAYFINLFNLIPLTPLDGGRIATAISPWLWLIGLTIVGWMMIRRPNFILILILLLALPRVFSLFKARDRSAMRYFELSANQRMTMTAYYFGLMALLFIGMNRLEEMLQVH